ncbi:hypothetical protein LCGC14_0306380 [marine sediment metagenome]|uniref:Uncharacterized protein n=1 Tax=marine sediment metagenome TaxID=412755 RepID=A0A0F9TU21_9ZZZZ
MQEKTLNINLPEPKNPIKVIKDGKEYEPHMCYTLEKPFVLVCKSTCIRVHTGYEPVYFKRKKIKIKLFTPVSMEIKYRIGYKYKNKEISYWINPKGEKI